MTTVYCHNRRQEAIGLLNEILKIAPQYKNVTGQSIKIELKTSVDFAQAKLGQKVFAYLFVDDEQMITNPGQIMNYLTERFAPTDKGAITGGASTQTGPISDERDSFNPGQRSRIQSHYAGARAEGGTAPTKVDAATDQRASEGRVNNGTTRSGPPRKSKRPSAPQSKLGQITSQVSNRIVGDDPGEQISNYFELLEKGAVKFQGN